MVFENIDFVNFISWFEGIGGFDIILPFLLIFAITFAILDKIGIFEKANINTVIAVISAFFLVMQRSAVELIQNFLPRVSMVVLTIIMLLLVVGAFGFGLGESTWQGLSVIVAIASIIWALGASLNWDVPWLDWFTEQDVAILMIVGIFILVIWLIVREKPENKPGFFKTLGDSIQKLGGPIGGKSK